MHSDFVVSLRKVGWKKADFPNAEEILFRQYCEIQRLIKRTALTEPRLLREFAYNTLREIDVEEKKIRERAERAHSNIKATSARKDNNNRLSEMDLTELKEHEIEFQYFSDILTSIDDGKGSLLEYLAAYYPEEVIKDEKVLAELRKYLPVYNIYRQKIEKGVLDQYFENTSSSELPFHELSQEAQATEIIGHMDFERASEIICTGISVRMPKTLQRLSKLKEMRPEDKKAFDSFKGISQEEGKKKLKNSIVEKRDSITLAYENVLKKIDVTAVDPEFTKQLTKKTIYENIIHHKQHYVTLRQYPSDWNNTTLFAELWAYHLLIKSWNTTRQKSTGKPIKASPTLENLFYDVSILDACVQVLREVDPPVIDNNCKYIGNTKGAFCIWIDELRKNGIIKKDTRNTYTTALNSYFSDLRLEETTFSKVAKKGETQYRKPFTSRFFKLKQSQSSRK